MNFDCLVNFKFKLIVLFSIYPFCYSFSQCPGNGTIKTNGSTCVGSAQLQFSPGDSIIRINWYNNGVIIDSTFSISAGTTGVTVAGGNGDGSAANQFNYPFRLFIDSTGIVYVADQGNHRIQKWYPGATSGVTVAGGNGSGTSADQFRFPICVFVDGAGVIYIGDNGNYRIQKWLPGATAGVTVAGGNGAGTGSNQFLTISSIYVDKQGAIYVADLTAERVQKWLPGATTGITVAGGNGQGNAANQLSGPADVFVDPQGIVYIADAGNYRVQKWLPGATSGITVAGGNGTGAAANQFNGVSGVFVDSFGNLYVSDASNHRVQKWPPGATAGVTVAGGNGSGPAANQLSYPNDVQIDRKGNIYIMDTYNSRVQKWVQSRTIDSNYIPKKAGLYKAVAITAAGCILTSNEIQINAVVTPSINIHTAQPVICSGDLVQFSATTLYEGTTPVYQWSVNGINTGTNSPVFSSNALQNSDVVTCRLTSSETCTTTSTVHSNPFQITVRPRVIPTVQIQASSTRFCAGDTVQFTATPSNEGTNPRYYWTVNGIITGSGGSVFTTNTLNDADIIHCTLQSNAACVVASSVSSNSITVAVKNTKPSVRIAASNTAVCEGEDVRFTAVATNAVGMVTYKWTINGKEAGASTPSFLLSHPLNKDTVLCKIRENDGCSAYSNPVALTVYANPTVSFSSDYMTYPPQGVLIKPAITGSPVSYSWKPVEGLNDPFTKTPLANPALNTLYFLTVVSADGCKASGSVWVKPVKGIFVPSGFTPNKDGKNDVLYVLGGKGGDIIKTFTIFDRWGAKIFQVQNVPLNDPKYGWDGTHNGTITTPGTYVYVVEVIGSQGETSTLKGTATLIR